MMLSRPLPAGFAYPYDWGFVAGTRAPDGDPLDAVILWEHSSSAGLLVPSRPIGALGIEQAAPSGGRQRNDRLVVIPHKTPTLHDVRSVDDLPDRLRAELEHFFTAVVAFEHKQVRLLGWSGPAEADQLVRSALI
jgi:inorganic pyrophosphatase